MKIHEYQAKEILRKYGVPVPEGEMVTTLEEADKAAKQLFSAGNAVVVIKAQIHAGGRGKGGGVKVTKTIEDANAASKAILGMQLVTHQTGPQGQKVQRLLVEAGSAIERELYLGITLDRLTGKLTFMASQAGGMEIEEVAHENPDAIYKEAIEPALGLQPWQARNLAFKLGLKPTQINQAVSFMLGLYKAYVETDCSLLEINPFITTKDDKLAALDCKINFDDNAMYRHKDLKELRDIAEEDPLEVEASKDSLAALDVVAAVTGRELRVRYALPGGTAIAMGETGAVKKQIESADAERDRARLDARERQVDQANQKAQMAQGQADEMAQRLAEMQAKQTERGIVLTLQDVLFDTGRAELKSGASSTSPCSHCRCHCA